MTYTADNATQEALSQFRQFDADTQLGLLWFGYLDLKDQLQPGAGPSVTEPAQALYHQIADLPQEEQLQAQRDIVNGAGSNYTRVYDALFSSAKLELWLLLAQGMEEGKIIGMPENYQLPESTNDFANRIKQLDFEQRLNFMRSAVVEMGSVTEKGTGSQGS
jgi:hypothetical protein